MEVKVEKITTWKDAYREALATENKTPKANIRIQPEWIKSILLAEHSPIRVVEYRIEWTGIKYWVAMHLRTHQIGIYHPEDLVFVNSQRDDRNADTISRDNKTQDAPVRLVMRMNTQSIINVSRKRLCSKASQDTQDAWREALRKIKEIDADLADVCVQECLYRGFCPERKTCGYTCSTAYTNRLIKYRHGGQYGGKEDAQPQNERALQGIYRVPRRKQKSQKCREKTKGSSAKSSQSSSQEDLKARTDNQSIGEIKAEKISATEAGRNAQY
jgi:hypothetical protein